ncbi:MAG TPA: sensory rhodopsin transducer [Verrucomicrobiae bacterium]
MIATRTFPPLGHKRWAIAEGYIPSASKGPEPQMTSHETACILNVTNQEAHVEIWIFYSRFAPVGPYKITVPPQRTQHVRFNDLNDPTPIPRDTDYASVIESDIPVIVQHTRLDSRQAANSVMTTMAFADAAA